MRSTALREWVSLYHVDVLDMRGEGVSGIPVEARYMLPGSEPAVSIAVTDSSGRAIFADRLPTAPTSLTVSAGRETVESATPDSPVGILLEV